MARGIGRLSGADVRRSKPGFRCDGGGLWLQTTVAKDGKTRNRSWVFRYTLNGVRHHAGLGSCITVDLKTARERARRYRELLLDGIDPIAHRDAERSARIAANAKTMTFEEAAMRYIAAHRARWRNQQHAAEWPTSLRRYIFPTLGKIDVREIDTALVVRALEQVWGQAPETGSRLRGRVESILDWCGVQGLRPADVPNPARWSGHIEHVLPKAKRQIEHHPALPWREVPEFMVRLRQVGGTAALAFEFLVLTAARAGEVRGMVWSEVDPDNAVWVIPGQRMKSGREHRVPLSPRCVSILREMEAIRTGDFVFPGRDGKLGESAFHQLLKNLGRTDITTHGFRSSFRDWAAERTAFPREVAELALAHAVGDAVERSYQRSDLFERRRQLMDAWAGFCAEPAAVSGEVVPIRTAAHA
jgi:integrase